MIALHFYNTLTRKKELFHPIDKENIRLYVCGPTIYDNAHIGNARPVIVFDILYRLLCYIYGTSHVLYARNITDIDDKINARAVLQYPQLSPIEAIRYLTKITNAQFQEDIAMLACLEPNTQPRATEHISHMCALIEKLIERGHAYVAGNHVLFSIKSIKDNPRYGELSRRTSKDMLAGARVDAAPYKQNEIDFVLWKPSKATEPGWKSPGGIMIPGRPGWHIECSAMSMAKLLEPFGGGLSCHDPCRNIFDIHGGGIDLVFPHHENEIAQSCSAFGTKYMANFWMHNGFLQVEGKKMSKSLGNFITIRDILKQILPDSPRNVSTDIQRRWSGLSARFSMLQTHYREPINWTYQRLCKSSSELYRWYVFLRDCNFFLPPNPEKKKILVETLADDLNTWQVITLLRRLFKERDAHALYTGMHFMGLFDPIFIEGFSYKNNHILLRKTSISLQEINIYIEERTQAIKNKNWSQADRIRDFLATKNILLRDSINPDTGERITDWDIKNYPSLKR